MHTTRTETSTRTRLDLLTTPRARHVAGVLTFALLTAISAKVALPIPGTTVPFTFQPLAVVLAGLLLGARLGATSQVIYLMMGVLGIPVFFGPVAGAAYLLGPTGGYLIAYPLAAFLAGRFAGAAVARTFVAALIGLATIYAGGVAWLAVQSGWAAALTLGLLPFLLADLVKMVMAVVVSARLRDRVRSIFSV
jgi:biotin transport system substrate-specific component